MLLGGHLMIDLKGISPTVCMHKTHLEEKAKTVRQIQCRLNPHMKEVVKILDVGIIYPISYGHGSV